MAMQVPFGFWVKNAESNARRRRSRSLALLSVFLTQNPKGTCIDIASSSTWQILLDSISAMSEIKTTDLLDRKF